MLVQQEEQEVFMKKNLQLPTWNCQEKHISKIELTAANLELAGVGIQRVVVEVHPAGDGDADPAEYMEGMYCSSSMVAIQSFPAFLGSYILLCNDIIFFFQESLKDLLI